MGLHIQTAISPFSLQERRGNLGFSLHSKKAKIFETRSYSKPVALFLQLFHPMLELKDGRGRGHFVRPEPVINEIAAKGEALQGKEITNRLNECYIRHFQQEGEYQLDQLPSYVFEMVLSRLQVTERLKLREVSSLMRAKIDTSLIWETHAKKLHLQANSGLTPLDYKEKILTCMRESLYKNYSFVPYELFDEKAFTLKYLRSHRIPLSVLSYRLRNDKDVVSLVVKKDGMALFHASDRLKDDSDVVREAVKENGLAVSHASKRLQGDREIVLLAVGKKGSVKSWMSYRVYALDYASDELKRDEEILLHAIEHYPAVLTHVPCPIVTYRDFNLKAVQRNGLALKHVLKHFQDDEEIVLEALKQDSHSFWHASKRLKNDDLFVQKAVQSNYMAFRYASDRLRNDPAFLQKILNLDGRAIRYISYSLRNRLDLALIAVRQNSESAKFLSKRTRLTLRLRWMLRFGKY